MTPSSKAISVSNVARGEIVTTTIACEDGSVWERDNMGSGWICILEAPTQPKTDFPEVGSRWRVKGNQYADGIEVTQVSIRDEGGEIILYEGEDFFSYYEPIPAKSDK